MHYHHEKPDFFRFDMEVESVWGKIHLFLDTDKTDHVTGFFYLAPDNVPSWVMEQFSLLAKNLEGQAFNKLPLLKGDGHFPYASFCYQSFIKFIQGEEAPWYQQKGRNPLNLLCRCFGVYKEDIHELVGKGIDVTSLRDLGDHLRAGIGCGTCHDDLLDELRPLISAPIDSPEPVASQALWEKLDPQSLANEVFNLLQSFSVQHKKFGELKIAGTRPGSVLVKVQNIAGISSEDKEELKTALNDHISKTLGPGLKLVLM